MNPQQPAPPQFPGQHWQSGQIPGAPSPGYPGYPGYPGQPPVPGPVPPAFQPSQPAPQSPQPYMTPQQAARAIMRRAVNRPAGVVLLYAAVAQALGAVFSGVAMLMWLIAQSGDPARARQYVVLKLNDAYSVVMQYMGVISLASFGAAALILFLLRRRMIARRGFWVGDHGEARRMRAAWALDFLILTVSAQAVFVLLQTLLSAAGVDLVSPSMEALSESAITWEMWLYIGLVGPVIEELVFRGVLMGSLAPYGRNFAIVTSALMFALYHGDLVQGLFAFVMGLVLGFVAMEYSLVWSIALHVFNNAVLGGVLSEFAASFGDAGDNAYALALVVVGVIGGIVVFARHGREMRAYREANRSPRGTYWGWTAPWFLTYVILSGLLVAVSFAGAVLG